MRNRHAVGDWLVVDAESGFVHYGSEMRKRWDGFYVHKSNYETRNPQEFVRAERHDESVPFSDRPGTSIITSAFSTFVGSTSILNPTNFTNFLTVLASTSGL